MSAINNQVSGAKRQLQDDSPDASAANGSRKKAALPAFVSLTTHQGRAGVKPTPLAWGNSDPLKRGPVVASARDSSVRNAIGAHGGSYCIYLSLAVAAGNLDPSYKPNFDLTTPAATIGPYPSWSDPAKIVTMDPFGHVCVEVFKEAIAQGMDIRPTIAVTKAHIDVAEIVQSVEKGLVVADGKVVKEGGQVFVTKAAVEPVWYLPGVAERFNCSEEELRHHLFTYTNGMYPELLTRTDLKVFLPPIGGLTIYIFGDHTTIPDPTIPLTVRVHDECNGSDVFGSDICTCRPYLVHGIEECIKTAQRGGAGIIIYFRKEGRALGEVTKYLVYNRRKRQEGGDRASEYFACTRHVAGVEDTRFQALMPDALHWLGVTHIHHLVSMSDMKYNAITSSGITVGERVPIPAERVPKDAQVEICAKVVAGYHGGDKYQVSADKLQEVKGRGYE